MKFIILSLLASLTPSFAWAVVTGGGPEIPPGAAAIIVAGLTAGVLLIRNRRAKSK